MLIAPHQQAGPTPHVRALLAARDEPVAVPVRGHRSGHPQRNGLGEVFEREQSSLEERFNGTLADSGSSPGQALRRTRPFRSSEGQEQALHRYVTLYNHPLPHRH